MFNEANFGNKRIKRLSLEGGGFISLDMVKDFLRIKNNSDDDLLNRLIEMAIEYAEWYMEKSLIKQKWQLVYKDHFSKKIYLNFGPVINVERVFITNNNVDYDVYDYSVHKIGGYIQLDSPVMYGELNIIYLTGYEQPNLIPGQIKEAILLHISSSYHQKSEISMIQKMYSPFREYKTLL